MYEKSGLTFQTSENKYKFKKHIKSVITAVTRRAIKLSLSHYRTEKMFGWQNNRNIFWITLQDFTMRTKMPRKN